ncbi:MAG TPA: carboxypeptidase M32, partial [Acidobacteriota bacterium]|nr:carboxypeptidase M32 [Acidobacteriota bacterium]
MATTPQDALTELKQKTREISILQTCGALLDWDEHTYMPSKGSEFRAEQLSYIAGLTHGRMVDPRIGELIETIKGSDMMDGGQSDAAVVVREVGRVYDRATKMPQKLVEEISKTASLAQNAWQQARAKADYALFKPWLAKMIDLKKQEAEAVGYTDDPYNALLDDFEPGATVAETEKTLTELRKNLVVLLDK